MAHALSSPPPAHGESVGLDVEWNGTVKLLLFTFCAVGSSIVLGIVAESMQGEEGCVFVRSSGMCIATVVLSTLSLCVTVVILVLVSIATFDPVVPREDQEVEPTEDATQQRNSASAGALVRRKSSSVPREQQSINKSFQQVEPDKQGSADQDQGMPWRLNGRKQAWSCFFLSLLWFGVAIAVSVERNPATDASSMRSVVASSWSIWLAFAFGIVISLLAPETDATHGGFKYIS
ncbi:hypothetical protein FVE85_1750 [Porphyridium purpureum]|uniref:Uncharacterized protein n=1 Tax=Porphyridium purpureum TaxID=35688 RepID=A0A5J4YWP9_PORPP|nr:hypothetical protein FVE85_1750 [Porphyridium purpureum]|eukprot:POR5991..scf209_3